MTNILDVIINEKVKTITIKHKSKIKYQIIYKTVKTIENFLGLQKNNRNKNKRRLK